MDRKKLHNDGPECSRIVSGAWRWHQVSGEQVDKLVRTALDQGITSFDHADIYGDHSNEEAFGDVLRKQPSLRNRMQLITKCGIKFPSSKRPSTRVKHYDTSPEHIRCSVENSLKMLGTDRIDVLLIHRPDPLMSGESLAATFDELKKAGKVLFFGVSNFTPAQFRMVQSCLSFPLVTNQVEFSLSQLSPLFDGTLDTLMEFRASPMAWSPLGGGKSLPVDERILFSLAARHNCTYGQLALAWLMKHPSTVFPVIGTTKAERIEEAARSLTVNLDRQDWFELLKSVMGKEVP